MQIQVLRAGPMTTVQDAGRFGFMEVGIGQSGVMDLKAYQMANRLVGNKRGEAVLEATLLGPELVFDQDTLLAFTGADMKVTRGTQELQRGKAQLVRKGERIAFGMAASGVRTYIAISGGFDVPVVMNSRATDVKCQIGGFHGRKLVDGDVLKGYEITMNEKEMNKLLQKQADVVCYPHELQVRVVAGQQEEYFTTRGIETFYHTAFQVSPESDRMGIRLNGESIETFHGTDIVSDGIVFGSIQITSSGQPIVLMADHQTTGGYAKIAAVIKEDLPILAQARPGDTVSFQKVRLEQIEKHFFGNRLFRKEKGSALG